MHIAQTVGYVFLVLIVLMFVGTTIYSIRNEIENLGKPKKRYLKDTPIMLFRIDGQLYATYSPYVTHNAWLTGYHDDDSAPVIKSDDGKIVEEPVQFVLANDYHESIKSMDIIA